MIGGKEGGCKRGLREIEGGASPAPAPKRSSAAVDGARFVSAATRRVVAVCSPQTDRPPVISCPYEQACLLWTSSRSHTERSETMRNGGYRGATMAAWLPRLRAPPRQPGSGRLKFRGAQPMAGPWKQSEMLRVALQWSTARSCWGRLEIAAAIQGGRDRASRCGPATSAPTCVRRRRFFWPFFWPRPRLLQHDRNP